MMLKTDIQSINSFCDSKKISYKDIKGETSRRFLFKEDVLSLMEKNEFVSLNTLSSYIGLHRGQCKELVTKGIILGNVKIYKDKKKKNIWLVDREDMESYFNSFFSKMPNVSSIDNSKWISFNQAIPKLKSLEINSSSLINLINKSKFQACLLNVERSIGNIYLKLEEVEGYIEKMKLLRVV
jgi:hypothetical protein